MLKRKGGELRNIKVKEVSIVDAPATRRTWLFLKSDVKKTDADIRITSDGTHEGTKLTVNGEEIEDLKSFYFSYFKPAEGEELYIDPLSCSYTVSSDAEGGFQHEETYNLAKGEDRKMDFVKLGAFVKALTGKDVTEEQFKKMDETTQHELFVLSQYEGQMPTDLSKAVGHFMKLDEPPADPPAETPKDPPEDPPATSGELTPETLASLQTMVDGLTALITGKKVEKGKGGSEDVLAKLQAFADRIGKLEKGETPPTENQKVLDLLKSIEDRLQVVEKSSGIEKGILDGGSGGTETEVDLYSSIDL
jgi:hypothetical protein